MPDEDQDAPRRPQKTLQFSLRTLFALTAACALLSGMWAWRAEQGVLDFFLGASACLIGVGVVQWRIVLIAAGIAGVLGTGLALSFSARRTAISAGSGRCTIAIPVRVVDAATKRPIPGATVRIQCGWPAPDPARTGSDGTAVVDGHMTFISAQYVTLFGTRGRRWISFSGVSASIEAQGYRPLAGVFVSKHFGQSHDLPLDPLPSMTVELKRTAAEVSQVSGGDTPRRHGGHGEEGNRAP